MEANSVKQTARQEERELWLVLAGAMLTGNKIVLQQVAESLDPKDAPDGLVGLFDAIHRQDRDRVWEGLRKLGLRRDENTTCIGGVIKALAQVVAKRTCAKIARQLEMSSRIEPPEEWCEYAEKQVEILKSKLRRP